MYNTYVMLYVICTRNCFYNCQKTFDRGGVKKPDRCSTYKSCARVALCFVGTNTPSLISIINIVLLIKLYLKCLTL